MQNIERSIFVSYELFSGCRVQQTMELCITVLAVLKSLLCDVLS